MIKYYAYYSFGGYKDMYLGTYTDTDEYKYFLPLLKVKEEQQKTSPDPALEHEIETMRSLPQIICLTEETVEYSYPPMVRHMISHAGYKVLYQEVGKDTVALSVRDVPGEKDVYGRYTMFTFVIVADGAEDIARTDRIASYLKDRMEEFSQTLTKLFIYDFDINGLKFNLSGINTMLSEIINDSTITVPEEYPMQPARMVILPTSGELGLFCKIHNTFKKKIAIAYSVTGEVIHKYRIPLNKGMGVMPAIFEEDDQSGYDKYESSASNEPEFEERCSNLPPQSAEERIKALEQEVAKLRKDVKGLKSVIKFIQKKYKL